MGTLCKGYMVERIERDFEGIGVASFETLYAVLPSGEIFASAEIDVAERMNPNFDRPGLTWSRVAELPAGRIWIGHYPIPDVVADEIVRTREAK